MPPPAFRTDRATRLVSRRTLLSGLSGAGVLGSGLVGGCSAAGERSGESKPEASTSQPDVAEADKSFILGGAGGRDRPPLTGLTGSLLAGPHLTLVASRMEFSDTLTAQLRRGVDVDPSGKALRAAEGQEWLVLALDAGARFTPTDTSRATAELTAGRTVINVSKQLGGYLASGGYTYNRITLVVAVAKDAPITLTITDAGKTATLNVRTMKRSTDADTKAMTAVARKAVPRISTKKLTWRAGWTDGQNVDVIEASFGFTPAGVVVGPWAGSWAKRGRQWIRLQVKINYKAKNFSQITLKPSRITLTAPGGKTYRVRGKSINLLTAGVSSYVNPIYFLFEVPVGFTKGTLKIEMPTSYKVTYRDKTTATLPLTSNASVLRAKVDIDYP